LYVFTAAIERGLYGVVFLGAVLTIVALYYYLLVAREMYIEKSDIETPVAVPGLLGAVIFVCILGVVGIGLYPGPWVESFQRVALALFT
jgi:NADH-quinone oxidoreductase subunit N